MWVDPTPPADDDGAPVPWPFGTPVLSTTEDVERGPFGAAAPYRCVRDAEAAELFSLLPPGDTGTMVVDDGGELRRIALRFDYPFHVVAQHRCT